MNSSFSLPGSQRERKFFCNQNSDQPHSNFSVEPECLLWTSLVLAPAVWCYPRQYCNNTMYGDNIITPAVV